ncbi:hypothetical protein [Methylobacterium brachythecii]|uniref:Uncharacterized protein n=1 Tax=Methylobacterium brachythecii TaxID=1176177 RepID=A0A7W6APP5_9HYPH|nr:hypothetical protein [Methylobacterium brachythecii]MBB3904426.1 hypothetical protein [Methylobacterium brachythecii]GLS43645.1 hypothetical protein GCM10007884_16300 [Methylobacterium brachythecii]
MVPSLTTSPKVRWGIPLVLPHVLLSVGFLIFVFVSERPASSRGAASSATVASTTGGPSAALFQPQTRRI